MRSRSSMLRARADVVLRPLGAADVARKVCRITRRRWSGEIALWWTHARDHNRGMRSLAAAAVLSLAVLAPSAARASVDDGLNYALGGLAVGIPYVAVSAVLIGEGLDDAVGRGHGLAEAGAVFEIVWASLHLSAGIPLLIAGSFICANGCSSSPPIPAMFAVGASLSTVGAAYLAHGIWSLTGGRPPPASASLVPLEGGALASLRVEL